MRKLCRINIERSGEVSKKIDAYVGEVVRKLNPDLVILFGSFATGDINEGSDIDILVVADFKEPFLDRIRTLMDLNTFKIPIEPVGYMPKCMHAKEFNEMKNRKNPFIMEVLEKGKVVYKSSNFALKKVQAKMAGNLPQWNELEGKADELIEKET